MVFEYVDHDLTGLLDLIKSGAISRFSDAHVQSYSQQLLRAVEYLHHMNIIHRDLKCSNLLISTNNVLKLADFGLARYVKRAEMTNNVITLWYRPPEILLGARRYSFATDMWSIGCIIAELLTCTPLLPTKTEVEQLRLIFKVCGTPDRDRWPEISRLPYADSFRHLFESDVKRRILRQYIRHMYRDCFGTDTNCSASLLDVVDKLLALNPRHRLSATRALQHGSITAAPTNSQLCPIPQMKGGEHGFHEFQTKAERHRLRNKLKLQQQQKIQQNKSVATNRSHAGMQ